MKRLLPILLLFSATTQVNANLVQRSPNFIYDTDLNITWMQNANVSDLMTWQQAKTWADNLDFGGYSDWRLPGFSDVTRCTGSSCTDSELGHMYYTELAGPEGAGYRGISIGTIHNDNYALFSNLMTYFYWTGEEASPGSGGAWMFSYAHGIQNISNKNNRFYAWAVRDGDITAVPVPAGLWLFGSAIVSLFSLGRRKQRA